MSNTDYTDYQDRRTTMVEAQIRARGVRDALVLEAMDAVPREAFVPEALRNQAYDDGPLPIGEGQTISQPYIVAFMVEALLLRGDEKVLEIGSGSGYAAAVLGEICPEVYAIERIGQLAIRSAEILSGLGMTNVHVRHGDGTQGWAEEVPFDAILVSAGGPSVPRALRAQLKIGGRMVIPIGSDPRGQELVRVTRVSDDDFEREDIADVRFVPLIGREGWEQTEPEFEAEDRQGWPRIIQNRPRISATAPGTIANATEDFADIADADLAPLLDRIGDKKLVLLGEASHGTSEFYRMRQRITQDLIEKKGFHFVAAEADWPDAAQIDHYVRHKDIPPSEWAAFARFPSWMWRNEEVRGFVDWLHNRNLEVPFAKRAGFHGLDIYSLYTSIRAVLSYLENVDRESAELARIRYGCLTPWETDPSAYGHAALSGTQTKCESEVINVLLELLRLRQDAAAKDGERFFDAVRNAKLVANAERYYRIMYYGSRASWNLRDQHMFDTLQALLDHYGPESKGVVWAHNSHVGNATATEMSARGELNIGQLAKQAFGSAAYSIGFGTDHGTVAAASRWDGPMEIKAVQPSHFQSYERLFHLTNKPGFLLPLSQGADKKTVAELSKPRLERAIGVIYRPESERYSHYFEARLPQQFDEYIWIDKTSAVTPMSVKSLAGLPDTYPFGV